MGSKITTMATAALAFCVGIAVSFFTLPLWVTFAINVAKDGNRSDWLGLFGNAIGAAMTLVAAIVAWFAVQRQIHSQEQTYLVAREEAARERALLQDEAKKAAVVILRHVALASAVALLEANNALKDSPESFKIPLMRVARMLDSIESILKHFSIAEVWLGLNATDKANYLSLTAALHTIVTVYRNPHPAATDLDQLRRWQALLRTLAARWNRFDPELGEMFKKEAGI